MNEITPVGSGTPPPNLFGDVGALAKDDFLKILVTQLQNQDPVDPMNADQFASQLAEFSSLEQLQNMNTNLENTIELDLLLNQAINNTMATTLIGQNVKAAGNQTTFSGEAAALHYDLGGAASELTLEIRDDDGNLVRTVRMSNQAGGQHKYMWDGRDDQGVMRDPGSYTFEIRATDVEGNPVEVKEFVVGRINTIRYEDGSALLLIGDIPVNLAEVLEIGYVDNVENIHAGDGSGADDDEEPDPSEAIDDEIAEDEVENEV